MTLENLNVNYCTTGVSINNCTGCRLAHDTIYNNTDIGVLQNNTSDSEITDNEIYNNGWQNAVSGSQFGILPIHSGVAVLNSSNNTISNNKLTNNDAYNIYLLKSNSSMVANNTSTLGSRGIYVDHSDDNDIVNNNVTKVIAYGIIISNSNKNIIHNNILYNNHAGGILLGWTNSTQIIGNQIKQAKGDGVDLSYSSWNTIAGNNISNATEGIYLNDRNNNNNIYSNVIKKCKSGIDLHGSETGNKVSYNVLMDNVPYDIELSENSTGATNEQESNGQIYSNTIVNTHSPENETVAVELSGATRVQIYNNTISQYHICFRVAESSYDKIYNNKITTTAESVVVYSNSTNIVWDNGYPTGGNYWSAYKGNDTYSGPHQDQPGSDGVGDEPYEITAYGNLQGGVVTNPISLTDRYPLVKNSLKPTAAKISVDGKESVVTIVTSSTLLQVAAATDALKFTVTGTDGTTGYARVTLPKTNTTALRVYIDGNPLASSITSDDSYYYICIQFHLSTHVITIQYAKPKDASSISCVAQGQSISSGSQMAIKGVLNPALSNSTISLTITAPSGRRSVVSLRTGSDGAFSYVFTPTDAGTWGAQASWDGNDAYTNSTSPIQNWSVVESTSSNYTGGVPGYPIEAMIMGLFLVVGLWVWRHRVKGVLFSSCVTRMFTYHDFIY